MARGPRARRLAPLRVLAAVCVMLGVGLIGTAAWEFNDGLHQQHKLDQAWHSEVVAPPPAASAVLPSSAAKPTPAANGVAFAIRVPKIDYFAAIQEGVSSGVLYGGPGHYPFTPWPGHGGNVGVAAHNSYWLKFGDLKTGDEVDLETRYGTYKYKVTGSMIVNPDNTTVLSPTRKPTLTLTTCWPLYAGALAQQRYIIFADQVSPHP